MFSALFGGALMLALSAGVCEASIVLPNSVFISLHANTEPVYFRCDVCCTWDESGCSDADASIAGPTGGWPYYGWAGYPYLPDGYCCQPSYRHYVERPRPRRAARWIRWIL